MMKAAKRSLIVAVAVLVGGSTAFLITHLIAPPKDLRGALAAALHVAKEREAEFFINLPPAASRYPGAILVVPQMLVLEQSTSNDTGIAEGSRFSLVASDSAVADALTGFPATMNTCAPVTSRGIPAALTQSRVHSSYSALNP